MDQRCTVVVFAAMLDMEIVRDVINALGAQFLGSLAVEPLDLLALALAVRVATNSATSCASYKIRKSTSVKAIAGVLLTAGVVSAVQAVAPTVVNAVRKMLPGLERHDDDGGV